MTTHRSLNKLEFKAHMSIHNVAEVVHGEAHESAYTRDRLGRRHSLFDGDGTSRIFKPAAVAVFFLLLLAGPVLAVPERITVSSDELEQKDLNERLGEYKPEEKFSLFDDGSKSLGFNENGDPSLAMRY